MIGDAPNLHVAVAMFLGVSPQWSDTALAEELYRRYPEVGGTVTEPVQRFRDVPLPLDLGTST